MYYIIIRNRNLNDQSPHDALVANADATFHHWTDVGQNPKYSVPEKKLTRVEAITTVRHTPIHVP